MSREVGGDEVSREMWGVRMQGGMSGEWVYLSMPFHASYASFNNFLPPCICLKPNSPHISPYPPIHPHTSPYLCLPLYASPGLFLPVCMCFWSTPVHASPFHSIHPPTSSCVSAFASGQLLHMPPDTSLCLSPNCSLLVPASLNLPQANSYKRDLRSTQDQVERLTGELMQVRRLGFGVSWRVRVWCGRVRQQGRMAKGGGGTEGGKETRRMVGCIGQCGEKG